MSHEEIGWELSQHNDDEPNEWTWTSTDFSKHKSTFVQYCNVGQFYFFIITVDRLYTFWLPQIMIRERVHLK